MSWGCGEETDGPTEDGWTDPQGDAYAKEEMKTQNDKAKTKI